MDRWLAKRRKKGYDCAAFAAEVLAVPLETIAGALSARSGWRRLQGPEEHSLALMRPKIGPPHVGIYIAGGILHLGERMAMFQPLYVVKRDYNRISFYARRNHNN